MAWDDARTKSGRRLFHVVELALDYCAETYGVSPCTAVLGTSGERRCFNTRETCQDQANYNPEAKTYRFCTPVEGIPRTFDAIPSLRTVELSPTMIDPGRTLGRRGSAVCTFQDHPHHDRGIDKYVAQRDYDPFVRGTFFGKLRARNPHYAGRFMYVYTGYLPWDDSRPDDHQPSWTDAEVLANLRKRTYIIEAWDGPDAAGTFQVTGKDLLKLADDDRVLVPAPNSGRLDAGITAGDGSATLTPTGIGNDEYSAAGTILIGSESIKFTRSGDTLTLTARGADGTTAAAHDADDLVQEAKVYSSTRVDSIIADLLQNHVGISASYLPTSDWSDEADDWLSGHVFSVKIWKPTGVRKLLNELSEQSLVYLWWDDIAQEVKFSALRPRAAEVALTDDANVMVGSIAVADKEDERLTRVAVHFDQREAVTDSAGEEDFAQSEVKVDTEAEASAKFGDVRSRKIFSRWLGSANRAQAIVLANRLLAQNNRTPIRVAFNLGAKDATLVTGDVFTLATRILPDDTGAAAALRLQVLEVEERQDGRFAYVARRDQFINRYGFIGPDTLADYSSASESDKESYGFIGEAGGANFSDGAGPYRII